jgi:MFS family permease
VYKTLIILTVAQALAMTGPPIVVLLGGIVGVRLAPSAEIATLPVALMIVGTASMTIPAALLMARIGRKTAFIAAAFTTVLSGIGAAWAIHTGNFWLFCLTTFLVGGHNAFVQQYRFAVIESVPASKLGPSLSILMLAGVVAAYLGPETAMRLQKAVDWGLYSGSFIGLSILMFCVVLILCFYSSQIIETPGVKINQRPISKIILQPGFLLAAGASIVAYVVMSLVMTATPINMHAIGDFNIEDTTWVIQSHIMAMYLPSLVSGFIIARIGPDNLIRLGLIMLGLCVGIGLQDQLLLNYWWCLVLLGVGWNFLFLGGTTMLADTYQSSARFKVQAVNDFSVFSFQATAALCSGLILSSLGWNWLLVLAIPWLLLLVVLLWINRNR